MVCARWQRALSSLGLVVCCGTVEAGSAQSCARSVVSLVFLYLVLWVNRGQFPGPDGPGLPYTDGSRGPLSSYRCFLCLSPVHDMPLAKLARRPHTGCFVPGEFPSFN